MSVLSGIPRPIIAALGDISSMINEKLVRALCRWYADSASIVFLGHLTDKGVSLPADVTWIECDPVDELEEVLKDTDIIICPYLCDNGIDNRVFSDSLEVPVVTFFAVPGRNVHVVCDSAEFIKAVGTVLADLLTKPGTGETTSHDNSIRARSRPRITSRE